MIRSLRGAAALVLVASLVSAPAAVAGGGEKRPVKAPLVKGLVDEEKRGRDAAVS